ncbi:hypothetical protein MMC07_007272 [Pseudocyphellaria aurata]|nr:hypothetical protein [Pseudocyphellaria aurata]
MADKHASLAVRPKNLDGKRVFTLLSLSKPSFSQQFPLPRQPHEARQKALKQDPGPSSTISDDQFILSPLLTLPPAFGSAYVGAYFSCTLCANNELEGGSEKLITSVKITAEMQAPSSTIPLDLIPTDEEASPSQLEPGESLQKIVRFELREEGNHVLAVSLTYSETTMSNDHSASSGRVRTFRKLYQFVAQPCLSVRTKVSEIQPGDAGGKKPNISNQRFALEAQLENMADGPITLEEVVFRPKSPFQSTSINWDVARPDREPEGGPTLTPRDISQVAFLVEQPKQPDDQRGSTSSRESIKDGRTVLGQLNIRWRTTMGDMGFLSTGWLMARRR